MDRLCDLYKSLERRKKHLRLVGRPEDFVSWSTFPTDSMSRYPASTALRAWRRYQRHPRRPPRWLKAEPMRPAGLRRNLRANVISTALPPPPPWRGRTRSSQVEPGSSTFESMHVRVDRLLDPVGLGPVVAAAFPGEPGGARPVLRDLDVGRAALVHREPTLIDVPPDLRALRGEVGPREGQHPLGAGRALGRDGCARRSWRRCARCDCPRSWA